MVHALDEAAVDGVGVVVFGAAVVAGLAAAVLVAFCADAVAIKARARTKAYKPKRETGVRRRRKTHCTHGLRVTR